MNIRTRKEIVEWLLAHANEKQPVAWTGEGMALVDLGIDSLAAVELVCALEAWLKLAVPSAFLSGLETTGELISAVEDLQSRAHRAPENADERPGAAWRQHVNPYLAGKLSQLKMDRTFVRAEGACLYDAAGRRYLDFMAQYGALPFGHHPKEIWQAMSDLHADAEPVFAQPSCGDAAGRLAERLVQLAPAGLRTVTFANSGAEAVEAAFKMARHATGRLGILSTHHGFHGKTFGALSATGNADYQVHFGLPLSHFDRIEFGDLEALESQLEGHPAQYAAFVVEAIQGEGGVRVAPEGYLRRAHAVCRRFGVLLIVDEVQTGLGRTGAMFACESEGVSPDILTLAKALGGGMVPVGAVLCTDAAYTEKFALKHSSTFAGNALAARVGLATLELLTRDEGAVLSHVASEGAFLKGRLEQIQARHPWLVQEVRGRGFMLGIAFTNDRSRWPENFLGIAAQEQQLAQFVASYLLNAEGVRLAPTLNGGNVLRIQPPLNATHAQCVEVADALERTIALVASGRTGDFYRAILQGSPPARSSARALDAVHVARPSAVAQPAHRFAFLLHPLDHQGYADYDTSLASLDADELQEFSTTMAGLLDPVVGTTVDIESPTGARARGDFIMISYTADQLKQMPQRDVLRVLNKGIAMAHERGAAIVGLGAYTSVVSGGGSWLASPSTMLTSGNSYTVVSAIEALDQAVDRQRVCWSDKTAGVIGAAGAIGSCMAILLAERAPRLMLIGNPAHAPEIGRQRLMGVARALVAHVLAATAPDWLATSLAAAIHADVAGANASPDTVIETLEQAGRLIMTGSIHAVVMADVVVSATSFPGSVVDDDVFAHGAIVCDISRPRSVGESVLQRRPDVTVIDGGIVALPAGTRIGPYGIEDGTSYACMAETMLLALEGNFRDTSLGSALSVQEVRRQQGLARKHGFALAGLRSFGRPLAPMD